MAHNPDWDEHPDPDDPDADPDQVAELRSARKHNVPWTDLLSLWREDPGRRVWWARGAIELRPPPMIVWAGPEKREKSWIAMHAAVATVLGAQWLGAWEIERPGNVVYLDGEYGPYEFGRRIARLARGMGEAPSDVLPSIRYLYSTDVIFNAESPGKELRGVLRDVQEFKPSLIVVDPLRNHIEGNENDSDVALAALRRLSQLRDAAECPILLLHHLNKSGEPAGSRAWATRPDVLIAGTDTAEPTYNARSRTMRRGDSIAKPFGVAVWHTNDDDESQAACHVRHVVDDTPALDGRIMLALRAGPQSANSLKKSLGRSGADVNDCLDRLESNGSIKQGEGKQNGQACVMWSVK